MAVQVLPAAPQVAAALLIVGSLAMGARHAIPLRAHALLRGRSSPRCLLTACLRARRLAGNVAARALQDPDRARNVWTATESAARGQKGQLAHLRRQPDLVHRRTLKIGLVIAAPTVFS